MCARSVSERAFPANHSNVYAGAEHVASVSERAFPANHSAKIIHSTDAGVYLSGHSLPITAPERRHVGPVAVYLSGHSLPITACTGGAAFIHGVYLSGHSLPITAPGLGTVPPAQCI